MAVHNSMDALAAAALCYDYDEGPKLVIILELVTALLFITKLWYFLPVLRFYD